MPVRQRKRNGGTSTSTSTTSIASASTGRYEVPTRAQALPTRYELPDSLYTSEPDRNMSQASTLSTRAEQLAFDDFSNGDLLPEFIETTRQIHLQQQQLPHQSMLSERMTHRPKSGFLSRFQRRQKKDQRGDQPTTRARSQRLPQDTRTEYHPSRGFPTNHDVPNKSRKPKSIMKLPNLSRAPGCEKVPGSNRLYPFPAPSSSPPFPPPPAAISQYQQQDESDKESMLVTLQALFKELKQYRHLNHRVQRIQRTNDKTPVDGDWSYSTELSHKSSGESSLDRTNLERSSLHSRANATGSMDSLFSRATDLLIFSTHDFFFPRSKPLKNVKPSQRSEAEIHFMCQKLSKMVYPHESSVVAQTTIISSSIPTKIGLLLEQHGWRFVIRYIEKDSPFSKTPLKAGQTLLSINGIPANCFESMGEVVAYLGSREWSSDNGDGNNADGSVLSIVATRSIYASVIKPTADTLVGLGFAMNRDTGTLKIHYVDQQGLFGLKGCLTSGVTVLRLNGKPCPRTGAALNDVLKSCVGPFSIVALPEED